jgi:phage tail sheath protein FI
MPVVTTYPGVYIQEVPSGVQTITGVATSIAAFIGYTQQGPVDEAVHIFSFADYQRSFGGITADSPLSYAVNQFFQNGGTEAYVVRVASGATSASITLAAGGKSVMEVTASSDGTWGNLVRLDVDYNTINPDSLFNLTVTQFVIQNGQLAPALSETFRNLSMSKMSPNYFLPTINGQSQLISVKLLLQNTDFATAGYSQSGTLTPPVTGLDANHNRVAVSLNGAAPVEFALFSTPPTSPDLAVVQSMLQAALNQAFGLSAVTVSLVGTTALKVTSHATDQTSSVQFLKAAANDACGVLKLGVGQGGLEVEGAAVYRPVLNGLLGSPVTGTFPTLPVNATIHIDVHQAGSTAALNGGTSLSLTLASTTTPANLNDAATAIQTALSKLTSPSAAYTYLAGTQVEVDTTLGAQQLRLMPGLSGSAYFRITDSGDGTAPDLGLTSPSSNNFGHYWLGGTVDSTVTTVAASASGANGSPVTAPAGYGDPVLKTGIYSLENVDLFNIMCLPDVAGNSALANLYPQAASYCQQRRAMLIVDLPTGTTTISQAQQWLNDKGTAIVANGANAAAYFPQINAPDPLQNGNVHAFPGCGAIAGLWAKTDGQRGVWKAPAGTATQIAGATGLAYRMNDQENGILNPLGLNCLRTFPVIGTVVWGARTMRGADALNDDYKYVPVRRLTLYLEESLFRGTQWVVFEPNDEPLWARVRLTVGSFMQSLYRQGAFAGQTPQSAYFVKCDSETTTPYDQDQGRVNIIVGFAPLRPAEFVIIQIQQIVNVGPT